MTPLRQVVLALLFALSAIGVWPEPTQAAQLDPAVRDAVVPAAVEIAIVVAWKENTYARDYPVPLGSGTIVSPDGLILTNQHVVDRTTQRDLVAEWQHAIAADIPGVELVLNETTFAVFGSDGVHPPKPRYRASLVREDEQVDLAVLRISGDAKGAPLDPGQYPIPFVPIGDSSAVRLGDRVHLFAFPAIGGDALTYTEGVVSGFRYEDRTDQPDRIMTDAVMSGGSSGGTAVDAAGRLIGVPTQGSKLDCRPGDTNGDGDVTAEDVGCIPTGGSIGELRPTDLAKPLLLAADPTFDRVARSAASVHDAAQAPTPVPSPASTIAPTQTPAPAWGVDLPALALSPDDLTRVGLSGFGLGSGRMMDAAAAAREYGLSQTRESILKDGLARQGLQQFYSLWLSKPEAPDDPDSLESAGIESYVAALPNDTFASESSRMLADEGSLANRIDLPGIDAFSADSELTRWAYVSSLYDEEWIDLDLTFRVGHYVAGVRYNGPAATAPAGNTLRTLAEGFGRRLLSSQVPDGRPLSGDVVRISGPTFDDWGDAYQMRAGRAIPLSHQTEANRSAWEAWWTRHGITDVYRYVSYLQADNVAAADAARIVSEADQFASETDAAAFLHQFGVALTEQGFHSVQPPIASIPQATVETAAFSYGFDWARDGRIRFGSAVAVQNGDRVAVVTVEALQQPGDDALLALADLQARCLAAGCGNARATLPDAIVDQLVKSSASQPVTPSPSSRPTSTPSPPPTATPRPTPTPIPAFGFVDEFDAVGPDEAVDAADYAVSAASGQLTIAIKAPGGLESLSYDRTPTEGRDFGWRADIASTIGHGEILLSLVSVSDGADWWIAVDPMTKQWSMYRGALDDGALFYWVTPRSYGDLAAGPLRSIDLRVRRGFPVVFINGIDVTTPFGIPMPEIAGSHVVGFGAGINPASLSGAGSTFSVRFDRVRLYELR